MKTWCIHSTEYHSAVKQHYKILRHIDGAKKNVILSEINIDFQKINMVCFILNVMMAVRDRHLDYS